MDDASLAAVSSVVAAAPLAVELDRGPNAEPAPPLDATHARHDDISNRRHTSDDGLQYQR